MAMLAKNKFPAGIEIDRGAWRHRRGEHSLSGQTGGRQNCREENRPDSLTMENAVSCIVGYSCSNEGSVREFQRHTTQWGMGKNFDRTGGFGPWMVTADEVPPGGKGLKIETRLNGQVMQSDNTDNMMFPVAETIAYVTQGMTLEPGDIVFTGTPSGVGHARKPNPVWMKPGDVCEIHIEGVGVLVNPIEGEK